MDELVDILDSHGNSTGKTLLKSEAHRKGLFHRTVHIWLYTQNGKILIQQRAKNKETHPLLWDVSVAGHIGAGEDIEESAIREIAEEIGLKVSKEDLFKIGIFKAVHHHTKSLIDCEFHHTFLCELRIPLQRLQKQDNEVAALKLIPITQFSEETWGMANLQKYVPHGTHYYKTVIMAIKACL
ncbi:MAG: NUDIX domain-containing protein [Maribacter sp.]|nr:NUDIX domain-containing protein [Maribacter sp.]